MPFTQRIHSSILDMRGHPITPNSPALVLRRNASGHLFQPDPCMLHAVEFPLSLAPDLVFPPLAVRYHALTTPAYVRAEPTAGNEDKRGKDVVLKPSPERKGVMLVEQEEAGVRRSHVAVTEMAGKEKMEERHDSVVEGDSVVEEERPLVDIWMEIGRE